MTNTRQDKARKANPKARKPFDVDEARRLYEAGTHKLRDLAKHTGYCYGTVRRRLLEAGVTLDTPGGNRRKRKKAEPPAAAERDAD